MSGNSAFGRQAGMDRRSLLRAGAGVLGGLSLIGLTGACSSGVNEGSGSSGGSRGATAHAPLTWRSLWSVVLIPSQSEAVRSVGLTESGILNVSSTGPAAATCPSTDPDAES
jgi:hypothetical protein